MAAILNSLNLHSAILVFPLKLTHTCQDWFPLFAQKNLNPFILTQLDDGSHLEFCHGRIQTLPSWDSDTLLSSLRFTQKHTHSTLTLTQTNSIWLKLFHFHLSWWWQPSWILPCWIQTLASWIQTPCYLLWFTQKHSSSTLTLTKTNSIWLTRWWQPSCILPSWTQPYCTKL